MLSVMVEWTAGAPGFSAASQWAVAGRGSQSTITRSAASSARWRLSAITTATASPTKQTSDVASGSCVTA